jgi:hypothetical protein
VNHEQLNFEFFLESDTENKNSCENIIIACEQGLGFSLDRPISSTWSFSSQPYSSELPSDSYDNENISFDLTHHTIDIKTLEQIKVPYRFVVSRSKLEKLILLLSQDSILSDATFYYLKALDEPDQFFVFLYKAYETIKHTKIIPKKQADRFRRIANDPEVIFSRHAKPTAKLHGITLEEDNFCRQTIRNGILNYFESQR